MKSLRAIESCFQGVVPSYLATCSADGVPNVTPLSIVNLLGNDRIGLSCQFFNKSLRNLEATGRAQVVVMDPATLIEYRLDVRFVGVARKGDRFERTNAQLMAIASQTGMSEVFKLTGVVECQVTRWSALGTLSELDDTSVPAADPLEQLELVAAAIQSAADLESLLGQTFHALEQHLGLAHGFLLLMDGEGQRLYAVASHGFGEARIGAEVDVGYGIYGTCASRMMPLRSGSLTRERLMSAAIAGPGERSARDLPLPGLKDAESTIAIPLCVEQKCMGVLCFQDVATAAYSENTERVLVIVARHLAAMIQALRVSRNAEIELSARRGPVGGRAMLTRVRHFESDGSVFLDDDYLIKGVAGRILWRVLLAYVEEQREDFSNKEFRLDQKLGLPPLKDNLEARLIALRRRLSERCSMIRIEKSGRGRFRVEVDRELHLEHLE